MSPSTDQLNNHKDSISVTISSTGEGDHQGAAAGNVPVKTREQPWRWNLVGHEEGRRLMYGMKLGIAIVLVSLLYILDIVHDRLGDNSMWAIMTVVVMFEFTSGGTIGKGVNRGIGTVCGGGMGIMVAILAYDVGGWGRALIIASLLFIFCTAASYTRLIPRIKKRYDYGFMIFILTFSLVAVAGVRGDEIVKVAGDRLLSIFMGFAICIFTSVLIFPVWAGDELHASVVSKFKILASSIEENVKDYFNKMDGKMEEEKHDNFKGCASMIHSKTTDELMANFAKWEPWHGRFGFRYPWDKFLETGELLRDLAVTVLSLRSCIKSKSQEGAGMIVRDQCEAISKMVASILRETAVGFHQMTKCDSREKFMAKLENSKQELSSLMNISCLKSSDENDVEDAHTMYVLMVLTDIICRVEELVKKVGELEVVAGFIP